ncbi:MAG: hypothetical protein JNG89_12755 [Planctomycetaceae bacterium]|nr:hypothetical protein [Planctomycetaceae bacterium]
MPRITLPPKRLPFADVEIEFATRVFLSPHPQYAWNEIIEGVEVHFHDGRVENRAVMMGSSARTLRQARPGPSAKEVYDRFFLENPDATLQQLSEVTDRNQLQQLCNQWQRLIRPELGSLELSQLSSYGRLRRPIDLYLMHLIAMSTEAESLRKALVPLLFVPLDKQSLDKAFTKEELRDSGLPPRSSFGNIETEQLYLEFQDALAKRARRMSGIVSKEVAPIYFDLLWRDRDKRVGGNLFEASPMG